METPRLNRAGRPLDPAILRQMEEKQTMVEAQKQARAELRRELIASEAMAGILAHRGYDDVSMAAYRAVQCADALMAALSKTVAEPAPERPARPQPVYPVVIRVENGHATCQQAPAGVDVRIEDYDNTPGGGPSVETYRLEDGSMVVVD